jgi:hypothetical protein
MSNGDGDPIKKQVILKCYDFRKASVRLDTFVDSTPMMPAALESKSWFSTGSGVRKESMGACRGALGKGLLDWRLKTGYLFCIDNIISINERQKTSVTSQKGDGKGLL